METFVVWGVLLVMIPANTALAPIVDVNYKDEEQCEIVKQELEPKYPGYQIWCMPTWKPDEAKKQRARKKVATRTRTRTATRTTRRR